MGFKLQNIFVGSVPLLLLAGSLAQAATYTLDFQEPNLETIKYEYDVGVRIGIVLQAVSLPAGAWIFGSALVGLGWLKRKTAC